MPEDSPESGATPEESSEITDEVWNDLPEDFRAFLLESATPPSNEAPVLAEMPAKPTADVPFTNDPNDLQAQLDAVLAEPKPEDAVTTPVVQESAVTEEEKERAFREELAKKLQGAAFVLAHQVFGHELQLRPELVVDSAREALEKINPEELLEADLTEAAFVLARHVINQEIRQRPELVVESVREALHKIDPTISCTVHLNPADLPIVEQARDDLEKDVTLASVSFVPDDQIERGGCVAKTERSTVDTRPSVKFQRLIDAGSV